MEEQQIFTVESLAEYLQISVGMVRKLVFNRQINYFKIGNRVLFKKNDIEKLISENLKEVM